MTRNFTEKTLSVDTGSGILHVEQFSAAPSARGTVVFVHGKGVHLGRYRGVFAKLNDRGFHVLAYDQRGHGLSAGPRVFVKNIGAYVDDLAQVCSHLKTMPGPHVLMGHSLGALVAFLFLQRQPQVFSKAILLNIPLVPAHKTSALKRWLVGRVARISPTYLFKTGIDPTLVMKNREETAARSKDPLVTFEVTAPWYFAFEQAISEIRDVPQQVLHLPVLMMHGADDQVALAAGSQQAFALCAHAASQLVIIPGAFHEMLLDPEADVVFSQLDQFLTSV